MALHQRSNLGLLSTINTSLESIDINTENAIPLDFNLMGMRSGRVTGFGVAQITSSRISIGTGNFLFNNFQGAGFDTTFPSSAVTLSIASTSANDTGAGTGAQAILITGLDSNYLPIQEILALTGQTPVSSTLSYLRLRQIQVIAAGSVGWNVGNIYVSDDSDTFSAGVPDTRVYVSVENTWNLSMLANITVPADEVYYVIGTEIDSDATEAKPLQAQFFATFFTASTARLRLVELHFVGGVALFPNTATALPPKTDFWISTKSTTGTISRATIWLNFATQKV